MIDEMNSVKHILNTYCDKPPVIIEAGCYDGNITKTLLSYVNRTVKAYAAFECDPRNIIKIAQNNFPTEAYLVPKALGNIDGLVDLYVSEGYSELNNIYDSSSSIRKPKQVTEDWSGIEFKMTYPVTCTKLDTFCKEAGITSIDFIWADIQGAEKDMVLGGAEMMKTTKFMFLEHSENREWYDGQWTLPEMINDLHHFGFDVYTKFDCDIIFYNTNIITL